jgi:hypothetical protein
MRSRALAALLALSLASPALAGEPDDYYPWLRPGRDSAEGVNALVNDEFERVLRGLNRGRAWRKMSCAKVARKIVFPMTLVEYRFSLRARAEFNVDFIPDTNTEIVRYRPQGLYRYVPLYTRMGARIPMLWLIGINPVFPSVRVGETTFSLDKLAHFFPTGARYYDMLHREMDAGATREEALEKVLQYGVDTELGIWGLDWDVFSYADLESNYQGLVFFMDLCDGTPEEPPLLRKTDDGWALREPFDLRPYVTPCWDESFYNPTYTEHVWPHIRRALEETYCPVLGKPDIQTMRAAQRRAGCPGPSYPWLEEKIRKGEIPDPEPYSIDSICEDLRRRRSAPE